MSMEQSLCVEANLEGLKQIFNTVEEFGQVANWTPDLIYQVNLVLEELTVNIVNYGCESDRSHEIKVTLSWDSDILTVEIMDDGRAFNPLRDAPKPDLESEIEDLPDRRSRYPPGPIHHGRTTLSAQAGQKPPYPD